MSSFLLLEDGTSVLTLEDGTQGYTIGSPQDTGSGAEPASTVGVMASDAGTGTDAVTGRGFGATPDAGSGTDSSGFGPRRGNIPTLLESFTNRAGYGEVKTDNRL